MVLSDYHTALDGWPCDVGGLRSSPVQLVMLASRQMMLPGQSWTLETVLLDDDVSREVSFLADGLA